jgi:replicative DNA helicase
LANPAIAETLIDERLEGQVLGHGIDRPEHLFSLLEKANASIFGLSTSRTIFAVMAGMADQRIPVDLITLADELRRRGLSSTISAGNLADLTTGLVRRASLDEYINRLRDLADRRRLISECELAIAKANDLSEPVTAVLDELALDVQSISGADHGTKLRHVSEFSARALDELLNPKAPSGGAFSTGILPLDDATAGGIRPGEIWIFGALPARGKTTAARQILSANARKGIPCLAFSAEMSAEQWLQLTWAREASIAAKTVRNPEFLNASERRAITEARERVDQWPMFIDDSGKISVRELVARSRTAIKRDGVKIIVVDYLRLIEGPGKELREKIAGVTNSLRELAKAENVAVLALSQLSRPRDGNVNSEPTMLSLKESGDIEAHAHTVILSHMPLDDYGHPSGEEKLIIAKQRNGPCGPVQVRYDYNLLCFERRH